MEAEVAKYSFIMAIDTGETDKEPRPFTGDDGGQNVAQTLEQMFST